MKYPITPDVIEALPERLTALYEDLAAYILYDICRRFKATGEPTATAIEQIRELQRHGYSLDEVNRCIKSALKLTDTEFNAMWDKAVQDNQQYFDSMIDTQTLVGSNWDAAAFNAEIAAIERQTQGSFANITRSMGFVVSSGGRQKAVTLTEAYYHVLDDAAMRIQSGAESYDAAIREATMQLTNAGVQYVDYASGWHNRVDVAVRRACMTGITQLSAQYTEQEAELLDTPYREVSAHRGARDKDGASPWANHKRWQGKVYSVRAGDKYPSIYAVCGLGYADGLEGANCRHMHYPFIEGVSERTYTDEDLANIDPPPFDYQGKKYSAYEATQRQRQLEAKMRQTKRELIAAKATGNDEWYTDEAVRYVRLKDEYRSFSKAAGLRMQLERGNIAEFGAKDARAALKAVNKLI